MFMLLFAAFNLSRLYASHKHISGSMKTIPLYVQECPESHEKGLVSLTNDIVILISEYRASPSGAIIE